MQAFKLNLTVKVPENEAQRTQLESCSISSLLESYLLNFYGKEVPIEKNEYDGTGVALFAYMHDGKLSYFLILESPIKAVDINLVTENGKYAPSDVYNLELGVDGILDIYQYTGTDSDLILLFNRMCKMCELEYNDDNIPTTLSELDTLISKNYSFAELVGMKDGYYSLNLKPEHQLTQLDNYSWLNEHEIGDWIKSNIDSNLSAKMDLSEYITNYCE